MPEMKSILFPGDTEAYEVVDAKAREGVAGNAAAIEGVRAGVTANAAAIEGVRGGVNANAAAIAAAAINDAVIAPDRPWSSSRIVEAFCPPFEKSGGVVQVHPFPGSVLGVCTRIEPVQSGSGDPSPDNVRPISGWTGAKLWRSGINMLDAAALAAGDVDGSAGSLRVSLPMGKRIRVFAGKTYTIALTPADDRDRMWALTTDTSGTILEVFQNGSQTSARSCTFTPTKDGYFTPLFGRYNADRTGWDPVSVERFVSFNPCLQLGVQAEYAPYQGNAYTANLPEIIYGGTLEWNTGVLSVTHMLVNAANLTWASAPIDVSGVTWYYWRSAGHAGQIKKPASNGELGEILAEQMKTVASTQVIGGDIGQYRVAVQSDGGILAMWNNSSTETPKGNICFALAVPQTIQLTPQQISALSGVNTLFSDSGDTTVSGRTDAAWLLGQLQAQLEAQ